MTINKMANAITTGLFALSVNDMPVFDDKRPLITYGGMRSYTRRGAIVKGLQGHEECLSKLLRSEDCQDVYA